MKLGPSGVPLEAESATRMTGAVQTLTTEALTPLIDLSRVGWERVIEMPDGIAGVALGDIGVTTPELAVVDEGNIDKDRNTGSRERGFDDERLLTDLDVPSSHPISANQDTGSLGVGFIGHGTGYVTDESWRNNHAPLSTDSHAIESQNDSALLQRQHAILNDITANENVALHSVISNGRTAIDELSIGVTPDFDIGRDLTSPGSNGAMTDFAIFELEEFTLQPFNGLPGFPGDFGGPIGASLLTETAADLGQDGDQKNEGAIQHDPSRRGSADTLPLRVGSVKESEMRGHYNRGPAP